VCFETSTGMWLVQLWLNYRRVYKKRFHTFAEAVAARKAAEIK
jgi:hypothetical protein